MSFPAETQGRRGTDKAAMTNSLLSASAPQRDKSTAWQAKKLGKLCKIRTGKKDVNQGNPEGQFPFFTCAAEHTFSDAYSFDTEALLIAGNGDVGKVSYYKGKFEAYQRTYVLSDFTEVLPRFLYLILDGKLKDTVSKQKLGNTMPYIKVGMLTDFELPVPPLPEQERIVGILDEAFYGIAKAKATAEANLQNARAIFQSHLQTIFSQQGEGWVEMRLDTIAEFSQGIQVGLPDQSNSPGAGLVRFIRIIDYTQSTDDIRYVKDPGARYWASASDIVIVRYGTPGLIGRGIEGVIANNLFKITIINETVTNDFLVYYLGQQSIQKFLSTQGSSTMPALTFKQLGGVSIDFPKDLDKQRLITSKLDTLHAETQRLESLYQKKLNALDELKKSLLHQAFTGNL